MANLDTPVLTVLAILVKAMLYRISMGEGLGPISLLAGMTADVLEVLRGASLIGSSRAM